MGNWEKTEVWNECDAVVNEITTVMSGCIVMEDGAMRATTTLALEVATEDNPEPHPLRLLFVETLTHAGEVGANLIRAYAVAEYQSGIDRAKRAEGN